MLETFFHESWDAIPAHNAREHIVAAIGRYLGSYAEADLEGRAALFADDVVAEEPVGAPPMRGKAALIAFWKATLDAGWRVGNRLEQAVVNGDEALIVFVSTLAVPGEGSVRLRVFEQLEFAADGRIVRLRAFNDAGCLNPAAVLAPAPSDASVSCADQLR